MQDKLQQRVWQDPSYFLAFGFGTGLIPIAPGTWGTLAAVPVYLVLSGCSWPLYLALVLAAFLLGVKIAQQVSMDLGVEDHSGIVWDEIVGYLFTLFLAPPGWGWMILGFILFRLFDIWKPQPIRFVEKRVKGGLGVMLDDVLAACPSWIILQCIAWSLK